MEGGLNGPVGFFLAAVVAVLVSSLVLKRIGLRRQARLANLGPSPIPPGLTFGRQPVLTKSEAALYNMIQLAVQDHFLVFPQIPLWCFIEVKTKDPKARATLLGKIAFRRVDFALVHPGTLEVAKVIELSLQSPGSSQNRTRRELIASVLKAAGIEVITLQAEKTYALPDLAKILGVSAEE